MVTLQSLSASYRPITNVISQRQQHLTNGSMLHNALSKLESCLSVKEMYPVDRMVYFFTPTAFLTHFVLQILPQKPSLPLDTLRQFYVLLTLQHRGNSPSLHPMAALGPVPPRHTAGSHSTCHQTEPRLPSHRAALQPPIS